MGGVAKKKWEEFAEKLHELGLQLRGREKRDGTGTVAPGKHQSFQQHSGAGTHPLLPRQLIWLAKPRAQQNRQRGCLFLLPQQSAALITCLQLVLAHNHVMKAVPEGF